MSEVGKLVRSGLWLYLTSVVNTSTGFAYWLIISKIADPKILGLTTATIGIGMLVSNLVNIGLNLSLQRFIGECRGLKDEVCESTYFWTSMILGLVLYSIPAAVFVLAGIKGFTFLEYSPRMLIMAGIIIFANIVTLFVAYMTAVLKTRTIFISTVIGNMSKISVGVLLVLKGLGWVGAAIGYTLGWIGVLLILMPKAVVSNIRYFKVAFDKAIDLIKAGLSNWIPTAITIIGQWLGVIAVFGYSGALQTGYYYIANAIAAFVLGVSTMVLGVMLPVLSSMHDGRKRLTGSAIRLSLAIISPIALFLAFYPDSILGLLGEKYLEASEILSILIIGYLPVLVTTGITNLVYAYGMYRETLFIGLSQNLPRIFLYVALIPVLKGLGAAIAMSVGGFTGLMALAPIVRKVNYSFQSKLIGETVLIPLMILFITAELDIPWEAGLLVSLLVYLYYVRRNIITRRDLQQLAVAIMGERKVQEVYRKFKPIIDFLIPS